MGNVSERVLQNTSRFVSVTVDSLSCWKIATLKLSHWQSSKKLRGEIPLNICLWYENELKRNIWDVWQFSSQRCDQPHHRRALTYNSWHSHRWVAPLPKTKKSPSRDWWENQSTWIFSAKKGKLQQIVLKEILQSPLVHKNFPSPELFAVCRHSFWSTRVIDIVLACCNWVWNAIKCAPLHLFGEGKAAKICTQVKLKRINKDTRIIISENVNEHRCFQFHAFREFSF